MIRMIFKNLWARRGRNAWLLAELIVVTAVMWHLIDPVVVLTYNKTLPMGFQVDGLYTLSLGSLSSKSPRFVEDENTKEAKIANFRRIVERIRHHKDVQFVSYELGTSGPFRLSAMTNSIELDSVQYDFRFFYFQPKSDFFQTYGFDEVDGQTNAQLDSMFFNVGEVCTTVDAFTGKQMLGYHYNGEGKVNMYSQQPEKSWTAKATVGKFRMGAGQPTRVMLQPASVGSNVTGYNILIRTKPGISEGQFLHEFREWAEKELRIGNLFMTEVLSYRALIDDYNENNPMQVNYTYRVSLILLAFFMVNLLLGVAGTFWMQTRSRREEVGVMKSFGGSSGFIVRLLTGEGWVLATVATFFGCLVYLQYAVAEGSFYSIWGNEGSEYWVNNFWPHFFGVSVIVWLITLLVVTIGVYIPARSLSKITPTDALRDE